MKETRRSKIGILSLYHDNYNMGGLLQAYALTYMLKKLGAEAEQISLDYKGFYSTGIKRKLYRAKQVVSPLLVNQKFKVRISNFSHFMNSIDHSRRCDDLSSISNCYNKIVVGSDQVWGEWLPDDALKLFLLGMDNFTGERFSYAASIGADALSERGKEIYSRNLSRFTSISVREKGAQLALQKIGISTRVDVDPTILLSTSEWNFVSNIVNRPDTYIFCYFLGKEKKYREVASEFASKLRLPIVTMPYVSHNKLEGYDEGFGDYQDFESGPAEFIDLIKNAELVITDSFHATVFASKYHVSFFSLARIIDGDSSSNGRLIDYLSIINMQNRFVSPSELLDKTNEIEMDYSGFDGCLQPYILRGIEYLKSIVGESK